MSVCLETSTALSQPATPTLMTSSAAEGPTANTISITQSPSNIVTPVGEIKTDHSLAGKSIAKLVVTTQHGPVSGTQLLQKVVNSPLITVLNSTGPLTVVKSLCVTSVVSSAPQYTLVNSAPLNVTNTAGKTPTITVLNCGPLSNPVTVVKTISTQQGVENCNSPTFGNNLLNTALTPAIIENRGHNVFVKNTCPDSVSPGAAPQSHKLASRVPNNFTPANKPTTVNGQRNKLKILSNVQIPGSSQQNVMLNKTPNLSQPKYNGPSRPKIMTGPTTKYVGKPPPSNIKPMVNSSFKSLQDKPSKLLQPPVPKGPVKNFSTNSYVQKGPQGIKTLSPQHKNIPGQIQRTGSGVRTIPPQRPAKSATKPNYIGKHAVQAQKIKQAHGKFKPLKAPGSNAYGYNPTVPEKQLTFNQALTAQIIETLSNSSTAPNHRYEILPARYDSAFECPDKKTPDPVVSEEKTKSGLDALSLICQAVLLDHNYNATLPSEAPTRPALSISTQSQANGIAPTSLLSSMPNKRRVLPTSLINTSSHSSLSFSAANNGSLMVGQSCHEDDDAASDLSDASERKHDTEGEETDTAPEAEDVKNEDHYGDYVTRCICGFLHDDGYMVECDKCKVWQHVQCVVKNRQVPDEFLCELCDPTKVVDRNKARLLQQQWMRDRQLLEPKLRKDLKVKEALKAKEPASDTDSSDGDNAQNNNVIAKNRTQAGRKKSEANKVQKKEGKEPVHRRHKRKERKIVKRKTKNQIKHQQSHSDDENQDTWSAHLPQLRQWIEKYEEAVTNHYSPELRARISSIRINGVHVDSNIQYDATVCKCRVYTQPLTEIKYLISTTQLAPNTPVIELRGKYMLSAQHRNASGSLTTRQHTQRPGPFLFFYRLHKDNTEVCVDTRTYGNSARFIRRSCKPNSELRHCIEKGVLHLFIVSITTVEKNCELTLKHESHDLAAIGTTQIACACARPDECTVNKTTIKKNGEVPDNSRKRRGRRTISSSLPSDKSPGKERAPSPTPAGPLQSPPQLPTSSSTQAPVVEPPTIKDENIEVEEPVEVKIEVKEEPDKQPEPKLEIKKEIKGEPEAPEEIRSPTPPPVKTEIKKEKVEKVPKEESLKSPDSTPISTRRSSHYKSDKEEAKETDSKERANRLKKLSREERKLEAILRAIEQMEKADQKKQEHQAKQAHRRESEPGPNAKEEEKQQEPKVKRRRRRGRARTTSTNAQTRRTRLNSTDSYMTSGDENLLSPNDNLPLNRHSDDANENKSNDLLMTLSNMESDKKMSHSEQDSNSSSIHSSPETPQLSSACLLVQAAVEPLESGFKFPKTKKGLMNEWLNKVPDQLHASGSMSSGTHINNTIEECGLISPNNKTGPHSSNLYDNSSQSRTGSAKKRWLRQAISEDHSCDSPINRPDSPPISDTVAPPKKRRLPRESLSNDNSPPNTPTNTGSSKIAYKPRSKQEGGVEIVYNSGAEGDSPTQTMESETELLERASKMKQEFGKTVTVSPPETTNSEIKTPRTFYDPRRAKEMFSNSEHLVGTVEKTLSIFGFKSNKPELVTPAKRKLSITEYRQRKKLNTDKTDEPDTEQETSTLDDNSSESFKAEATFRPRSGSSSSNISLSSDETPADIVVKAPVFNSEPTELERQREMSSMRLKKAFGLAFDDEARKSSVIDMDSILKCDMETKLKPLPTSTFSSICELSMSPTLKRSSTPDRTFTPSLPSTHSRASPVEELDKQDAGVVKEESVGQEDKEQRPHLFYTPDDEEKPVQEVGEQENANFVPPFNNPVYMGSNFTSFVSAIDDDSRYQSRNPSPPPNLDKNP